MDKRTQAIQSTERKVPTIALVCPDCKGEGKTKPIRTPATHVWIPDIADLVVRLHRWSSKRLIETVPYGTGYSQRRAKLVCSKHGLELRAWGIRTYQLQFEIDRGVIVKRSQRSRTATA